MMKPFLKNISLFILLVIFIITFSILLNGRIINGFDLIKIDPSKNKLVLGASRTQTAINDHIMKDYFNNSEAGEPLFYTNIKLRVFKEHNIHIDTVILSLDNRTLVTSGPNRFYGPASIKVKLPRYFHFLSLDDWKKLIKIDLKSSLYSSTYAPEYTARLIKQILTKSKKDRSLIIGGYKSESHQITEDMINSVKNTDSTNQFKISIIERQNLIDIKTFCKENNIELLFVNPPLHPAKYYSSEYQQGKIIFEEFLKKEFPEYTYLNFSAQFLPDSCYADLIHLNKYGAEIFSKKLDSVLKNKN